MKTALLGLALLAGSAAAPLYCQVGQDLKNAGEDTKTAATTAGKKTGHAVKKGATKSTEAVKKGANKSAAETEKGANKVKQKTQGTDTSQ